MNLNPNNILAMLKNLVTGDTAHNRGFLKTAEGINVGTIKPTAGVAALTDSSGGTASATIAVIGATYDQAEVRNAVASLAAQVNGLINHVAGTADETNARVIKVEEAVDTVGNIMWKVPRDYDESNPDVTLRILASMVAVSTDTDVELDLEVYLKTPGTALTADLNPTKPGTILSTTEQWVEFNLATVLSATGSNPISRDDLLSMELITNGANDTDGEEILIHDIELVYRSTLVSYDKETTSRAFDLR